MRSRRAEVGSTPPPRAYPSCLHRHHATHARGRPVGGRRPAVSQAFDASVESVKRPEPRATAHAMPMERVGITNVAILKNSTHVKKKIRPAGPPSQTGGAPYDSATNTRTRGHSHVVYRHRLTVTSRHRRGWRYHGRTPGARSCAASAPWRRARHTCTPALSLYARSATLQSTRNSRNPTLAHKRTVKPRHAGGAEEPWGRLGAGRCRGARE